MRCAKKANTAGLFRNSQPEAQLLRSSQIMARAARSRGSLAFRQRLRDTNGGQSLIVTIIVLFVLLFLGGVFIALIANNLRNTRRGVQVSAADKFGEAGIKYLDQQLMTAAEGADWRPRARCIVADACTVTTSPNYLSPNHPDYFWLKPLTYNTVSGEYEGGYAAVNFGGPTASQSNLGGRALVRVSYRPYRVDAPTGDFYDDLNADGTYQAATERVAPINADRTRRYIKLESIGRVGSVDELDPTTFKNSQGLGLRRELVAYKALGLTESLRFITDKDRRRPQATLGAPYPVQDRASATGGDDTTGILYGGQSYNAATKTFTPVGGYNADGTRRGDGTALIVNRPIYNVYQGAIRSNTDLTFYGLNYVALDPRRGDALQVSGAINLNGLNSTLGANLQPTKVIVTDASTTAVSTLGGTTVGGNLLPSTSTTFSTFNGLVRDNPRGNETQDLPADAGNNNLRAVPRLEPPAIDAVTGDNGLTRYRALTRDSAPIDPIHTTPNPVSINRQFAGAYGWGQNLYIPNAVDLPAFSESISNNASQRAEWLNPSTKGGAEQNWRTDGLYVPPAVSVTLTPRTMALNQSQTTPARNRPYLRRPSDGRTGLSSPIGTLYRYTYAPGALATAPTAGIDQPVAGGGVLAPTYAGYPATQAGADGIVGLNAATGVNDDTPYYEGDLVIFAEGNIRIKGSAGGYDPETGQTFVRHLTVVSNGTVYIDGTLLRDNISPEMAAANPAMAAAKGKSTIALLAKNYIAVNTTQFLSPSDYTEIVQSKTAANNPTGVLRFTAGKPEQRQTFATTFAPIVTYDANGLVNVSNVFNAPTATDLNRTPPYLVDPVAAQSFVSLLLRHATEDDGTRDSKLASISLAVNAQATGRNQYVFNALTLPTPKLDIGFALADKGKYFSDFLALNATPNGAYLYPTNVYPYITPPAQIPTIGIQNQLLLRAEQNMASGTTAGNYLLNRFGIVPLDVRIEALMYAQEGSFFVIPGASFNPNPNDTYARFVAKGSLRDDDGVRPQFPFYGEPLDIRITLFGAITENLPAEIGDQGAWLQKWGWVPRFNGSDTTPTFHGQNYTATPGVNDGVGNGINYVYDPRLASPYDRVGAPLRANSNFTGIAATAAEPLPPMPRLPVAPGLLYYGERPIR